MTKIKKGGTYLSAQGTAAIRGVPTMKSAATNPSRHGVLLLYAIFAAILMPILSLFYHVPVLQTMAYFLGVILFLYLPGYLLTDILGWEDNPVSRCIISLLSGMAITPMIYYINGIFNQYWIFIIVMAGTCLFSCYRYFKNMDGSISLRLPPGWWNVIPVMIVLLGLLHLSHFSDLVIIPGSGYHLRTTDFSESIFHLGIINVVKHTIPAFYPYISGYSMSDYHIDMHILAAIFSKYLWIDAELMAYYFLPILLFGLITAVPALFFYSMHKNLKMSLLLGLLMFGADLSFIPGIMLHVSKEYPWTIIFCPTIWGLFTLNGIMAALPFFFGGALSLHKFYTSRNIRYLFFFSLFCLASYRVKSSTGLQMLGTALLAAPIIELRYKNGLWIKTFCVTAFTFFIIFLDMLMKSTQGECSWTLMWMPFNGIQQTAQYLALDTWASAIQNPFARPLTLVAAFLITFTGFMGLRLICLKYVCDFFRNREQEPIVPYLLIFIFSGIVLSEFIYLGGRYDDINNAQWFKIQAIIAATYFMPAFALSLKNSLHKWIMISLIILVSLPTTMNFLNLRGGNQYVDISRQQLDASGFIRKNLPKDAVILEVPTDNYPSISSVFGGRKTVFSPFRSFATARLSEMGLSLRQNDVGKFFGNSTDEGRMEIIRRYRISHLVLPASLDVHVSRVRWATKVFGNQEVSIYTVVEP